MLSTAANANALAGRLDLAVEQFQRSVDADPLSAVGRANLAAFLAAAGRLEEALAEERKAVDLNPSLSPQFEIHAGYIFMLQDRIDEAMRIVEQWPEGIDRDAGFAMSHHARGHVAEAEAALGRLVARVESEPGPHGALQVAEVHAFRGEPDRSFRWLATGRELAREGVRWNRIRHRLLVQLSPFLIPLRDDPRWEAIVAREPDPNGQDQDRTRARRPGVG